MLKGLSQLLAAESKAEIKILKQRIILKSEIKNLKQRLIIKAEMQNLKQRLMINKQRCRT